MTIRIGSAASDILARIEESKLKATSKPVPTTSAEFYDQWVKQLHLNYDDIDCIPQFSNMEKKQTRELMLLWGPECVKPILELILSNWIRFTKATEQDTGAFKSPYRPTFKYLYLHRAYAKNYWSARKDDQVVVHSTVKKLIVKHNSDPEVLPESEALPSLVKQGPVEEPATLDEVLAILSELKSEK
jgi:hypothetical protein